jgi:hypothetical protein
VHTHTEKCKQRTSNLWQTTLERKSCKSMHKFVLMSATQGAGFINVTSNQINTHFNVIVILVIYNLMQAITQKRKN